MTLWLNLQGYNVNIKRVRRLMNLMDLDAIYPRPRTTIRDQAHAVFPYLLRGVTINRINQVWSSDITYIPIESGYMYLTAVIDWYSRCQLALQIVPLVCTSNSTTLGLRGGKVGTGTV
jgi:putative transposase